MKIIKHYYGLALKELFAQRVMSVLILLAIILSTMMTAVIGQSAGVLSAMRQQQAIALGGNRYATFAQQRTEAVETMKQDNRFSFVGTYLQLGSTKINSVLTLSLLEYQEDIKEIYPAQARLKNGRLPEHPMEIALPENILQSLGLAGNPEEILGDKITLSLSKALRHGVEINSYDFKADFILIGILESNHLNDTYGIAIGIAGPGTTEKLLPESYIYYMIDFRTDSKQDFQKILDEYKTRLNVHELDTIYNIPYLEALGIRYNTGETYENMTGLDLSAEGFSFLLIAGILIGTLLLLAAGLVIYNILKIAVSRRITQYGILRAIGGERRQLYILVMNQILLLCAIGIPIGLLLGVLSARGILTAATSLLSPDIFLVQNAEELHQLIAENSSSKDIFLGLSALITLFFALFAALPAARYASEVSPVIAIAGQNSKIKIRRKHRKIQNIRNFEAYYARLNLKRNQGRTAITVLSLVMSITVFIALQGSVSLLDTAGTVTEHLGDYSLINETVGFSQDLFRSLEENPAIDAIAAIQLSVYTADEKAVPQGIDVDLQLQPGETFQMAGLNAVYWDAILSDRLSEEQLARLKSGDGCLIRNPLPLVYKGEEIPRTEIKAGSTITISGQQIPVLATLDGYDTYIAIGNNGFTNGVQVVTSPELYTQLTGKSEYQELRPILTQDADRDAFDSTLDDLTRQIPGTTWLSYEEADRQVAESFQQIQLLAWGLILFVGLIGLLNIINTVYTNIHTRISEIGIQRAIGMSIHSLYKIFLWEGAYYGIIAMIIGSISGYICTILIQAATKDSLELIAVPVIPILQAAVFSIGACLLATCIPFQKISKMRIVDSIQAID